MSGVVSVEARDETHVVVRSAPGIMYEIRDRFTFSVPGHQHMPAFRAGLWDGTVSVYDPLRPVLYKGLLSDLFSFCREREYELEVGPGVVPKSLVEWDGRESELVEWASSVTSDRYEDRDYQVEAFVHAVKRQRALFLSSTSSGKTLMIYRVCRFYSESAGKPALVITKRTNLVDQMKKDFESYAPDVVRVYGIKGGVDKTSFDAEYVVSTWQSACKMPREWFSKFSVVCVDEVHSCDSREMTRMMEKCGGVAPRFGFTGTLKDSRISETVLKGLFGPVRVVSTTRERMDAGDVAGLKIRVVQLFWDADERKKLRTAGVGKNGKAKPASYAQEIETIVSSAERRRVVADYVSGLEGNVLILFNRNESFGIPLFEEVKLRCPDRQCFLVYGDTADEDRERVREVMEARNDVVTQASLGTFAEGTSINNIKHLVLVYPVKSEVKLLQSIGRLLRKHSDKEYGIFHDMGDDIRSKSHVNYAWRHLEERIETYREQGFEYEFSRIDL